MKHSIKKIVSSFLVASCLLGGTLNFVSANTSQESIKLTSARSVDEDSFDKDLNSGKVLFVNLKDKDGENTKKEIDAKLSSELVVATGTDDKDLVQNYYAVFKSFKNKIIPITIFGKEEVNEDKLKEVLEEVKDIYNNKEKNEDTKRANGLMTSELSDSFILVGSSINLNISSGGTNIYYVEYRWYSKGSNGTTKSYYLRKDFQPISTTFKNNLSWYNSTWRRNTGNSYSVEFVDPKPTSTSNTSSITIGIPKSIEWTATLGGSYDVTTDLDMQNDVCTWSLENSVILVDYTVMKNANFTQGVYIESSVNNTTTRIDDNTTTQTCINNSYTSYPNHVYTTISGSTTGWGN